MDKETQEKLQKMYMEYQALQQQAQQLNKQIEIVANQINDLNATKDALEQIENTEPGKETFFPLASGIFLKGKVTDTKEVLMNIGANTVVKKTTGESKDLIEDQIKELREFKQKIDSNLSSLSQKTADIEQELSQASKE